MLKRLGMMVSAGPVMKPGRNEKEIDVNIDQLERLLTGKTPQQIADICAAVENPILQVKDGLDLTNITVQSITGCVRFGVWEKAGDQFDPQKFACGYVSWINGRMNPIYRITEQDIAGLNVPEVAKNGLRNSRLICVGGQGRLDQVNAPQLEFGAVVAKLAAAIDAVSVDAPNWPKRKPETPVSFVWPEAPVQAEPSKKLVALREMAAPEDMQLLDTPDHCAAYWTRNITTHPHFNPECECLAVLLLNTRRRLRGHHFVSIGTMDTILVHPREVFRVAVIGGAAALVLMHNHPSGDSTPSEADIKITRDLIRAGQILKIEVLDHVIMGHNRRTSLRELGYFYS